MTLPLASYRVLDLTRLLPGPFCTWLLADFGADVIKVEDPHLGDYARWAPPLQGDLGAMFVSLNRNKRSITLNLKTEQGKEIFRRLVKEADVLVESFRPGVMERLGLGYEALKAINPRLVYCAITGYGQDGPFAQVAGHDINYISYAGMLGLQGGEGGPPALPAVQVADLGGGAMMAAVGILLALLARDKTGRGQFVDISMLDGVIAWMQTTLPAFLASGGLPREGMLTLTGEKACYNVYETADGRYLSVGALEPKFWETFCRGIGREDFIPRLDAPLEEQRSMKREIAEIIRSRTFAEWMDVFAGKDACVAPVLCLDEVVRHPQVQHRDMIVEVEHPRLGRIRQIGFPIKLSQTGARIRTSEPQLGEHTEEILRGLGYDEATIRKWREEKVI